MCNISRFFHALKEQTVGEICLVELSLRTKRLPGMEINGRVKQFEKKAFF